MDAKIWKNFSRPTPGEMRKLDFSPPLITNAAAMTTTSTVITMLLVMTPVTTTVLTTTFTNTIIQTQTLMNQTATMIVTTPTTTMTTTTPITTTTTAPVTTATTTPITTETTAPVTTKTTAPITTTNTTTSPVTTETTTPITTTTTTPITTTTTTPVTTTTATTLMTTTVSTSTVPSTATTSQTTSIITTVNGNVSQCQNGEKVNNVCLCPNEYSGMYCEIPNFCKATKIGKFTFQEAIIGQFSYSLEVCDPLSVNANFSMATALCLNVSGMFGPPQLLDCNLNLDSINLNLSSNQNDRQLLATSAQILTSKPTSLSPQNISAAAQIASRLLSPANITEDIKLAAVTTVSQLLSANAKQFIGVIDNTTSWLTEVLQNFSMNSNNTGSLLVQPNLAVQSLKVNVTGTPEVHFNAFRGLNDTFAASRINVTNTSIYQPETVDVQMSIKFKVASSQDQSSVDVGFVLYNNDQFFSSKLFKDPLGGKRRVISGNLGKNFLLDSIQFSMFNQTPSSLGLQGFACVFWNYTLEDWSTSGCTKNPAVILNSSVILNCSCGHTTNFAVLMSFGPQYAYSPSLTVISIIGCSLSVAGLVITVLFQISTRKSRGASPTLLMVSVCICMSIFYLLFIFGINNPVHQGSDLSSNVIPASTLYHEADKGPCTPFTALLQYFLLATFTWSTLYAFHVYFLIKNAISGPPKHFKIISVVVGWGLPAVIVGISLGVTYRPATPLNYRQEEFCWLAALDLNHQFDVKKPMLWGFLLPLVIMLLLNVAIFFYFAAATCRTKRSLNSSRVTPLWKKMLSSLSLAVVLGLSWILGYFLLLSNETIPQTILSYAFCLCNTTQGIQIFVLFTVRTTFFKEKLDIFRKSVPAPELAMHRMSYQLWPSREKDPPERYRSMDFDIEDRQAAETSENPT